MLETCNTCADEVLESGCSEYACGPICKDALKELYIILKADRLCGLPNPKKDLFAASTTKRYAEALGIDTSDWEGVK
jgi:hypothetical protein